MSEGEQDEPPGSGFARLLARLDRDPERASVGFERLRRTLTKFFDWRGSSRPEECADETLDRLANKLEEGVAVIDVAAFAHGVARMVLREDLRSEARRAPLEEAEGRPAPSSGANEKEEELAGCLDRCLDELPDGGRDLVLAYYAGAAGRSKIESRRCLARDLGLTDNALRSRVQRLRDRLEECVRRKVDGADPARRKS